MVTSQLEVSLIFTLDLFDVHYNVLFCQVGFVQQI